jgi:transketolase
LYDSNNVCLDGNISNTFTNKIDDNFTKTLFTMMKELEFALQGGNRVDGLENNILNEE